MAYENETARFVAALGLNPNQIEWVSFEHQIGRLPVITVRYIPSSDQMNDAVSELIEVYQLERRDRDGGGTTEAPF